MVNLAKISFLDEQMKPNKKECSDFFSQESEKVDFDKTGQIQNAEYNEKSMTNNFQKIPNYMLRFANKISLVKPECGITVKINAQSLCRRFQITNYMLRCANI